MFLFSLVKFSFFSRFSISVYKSKLKKQKSKLKKQKSKLKEKKTKWKLIEKKHKSKSKVNLLCLVNVTIL